jgi:acyl-CoA thioester hydrolase
MENFNFSYRLRVRYSEIDGQKIVFNSHYLTYLDVTITEYFRTLLGEDWEEILSGQMELALVRAEMDFKKPARFDDVLNIYCRIIGLGKSSMNVEFLIIREKDQLEIVKAKCVYVAFDLRESISTPIPVRIRRQIAELEGI